MTAIIMVMSLIVVSAQMHVALRSHQIACLSPLCTAIASNVSEIATRLLFTPAACEPCVERARRLLSTACHRLGQQQQVTVLVSAHVAAVLLESAWRACDLRADS